MGTVPPRKSGGPYTTWYMVRHDEATQKDSNGIYLINIMLRYTHNLLHVNISIKDSRSGHGIWLIEYDFRQDKLPSSIFNDP